MRNELYSTILLLPLVAIAASQSASNQQQAAAPGGDRVAQVQEIVQMGEVRALPGQFDSIPMFNSNSPEWLKTDGILLSTFPPTGKKVPAAHLNVAFQGRFNLFAHHFTHTPKNLQTLYLGVIVHNPGQQPVTLEVLQAASYLMEPDAPFQEKPAIAENPNGEIFSGPGIRAVDNVLRGQRQADFPAKLVIPAGESRMVLNHPIRVRDLKRAVNGRSTFMQLRSSGKVYVASLGKFVASEPPAPAPTLADWEQLLNTGGLAGPRDKTPTPPNQNSGQLIYGRVAGVQAGSIWQAQLTDPGQKTLTLPQPGSSISYPIATLRGGTLGTRQIQSGQMLVRYPDTAYEAHGNYSVHYDLNLPLLNSSDRPQTIGITIATPLKEDRLAKAGLRFRKPPQDFPYFRGTVRLRYRDDRGQSITRYVHVWHRVGQVVEPLVTLKLGKGEQRSVRVDFFYPPDTTPPQVLTVKTLD